ncbi:hypothetical protein PaeBR_22070 [Paenibacillus sp. BR2-3]|uniref:hypothetical protein n=1 Tax=Paenibacillus sp. BR2-3 TaxID=3048494 RepID=UPI003977C046
MVAQLIWIAAVYASAVAIVHVLHILEKTRKTPRTGKWIHYVLITRNQESVIEWYIRALTLHAFLTGKRLRVTCADDSSTDSTLLLVSKMKQDGCSLDVETDIGYFVERSSEQRYGNPWMEQEIVVDLRLPGVLVPLPFMLALGSRGYGSKRG